MSVDMMKSNHLEYMCNKWEKSFITEKTFTLFFDYKKEVCDCDNSLYTDLEDYDKYECYECGTLKNERKDCKLYLQNSGNQDIVWVAPSQRFCELGEVYPNVYKWVDNNNDNTIYALHVENNKLSDKNIANTIDTMKDLCHITFTNSV
jgi:hypothetical protein